MKKRVNLTFPALQISQSGCQMNLYVRQGKTTGLTANGLMLPPIGFNGNQAVFILSDIGLEHVLIRLPTYVQYVHHFLHFP